MLHRMEEIWAEDFDHDPAYRRIRERPRELRQGRTAGAHSALRDVLALALQLFGTPEGRTPEAQLVAPEDLVLVAWERCDAPEAAPKAVMAQAQFVFFESPPQAWSH